MDTSNNIKKFMLGIVALMIYVSANTCSMYKLTQAGKTMVGNNEDSWGQDAQIWFEKGVDGKFGMACVGYARKYPNPDGAMNEYGLVFDAFTMPRKANVPERNPRKGDFAYSHLRTIMQQCKSVDEVFAFLDKLNLHILNGSPIFNGGMIFFVDKSGKYLVVEANKLTLGNDPTFLLANFSYADTKDLGSIIMERYTKGMAFLKNNNLVLNLPFCAALSDTMSVNRPKIGDGTLYTSLYDINEGKIHLYFYHDFSQHKTFDLKEELSKGNHIYKLTDLFPNHEKYDRFLSYQTPQNNKIIFTFIITCGALFFFTALYYILNFFRSKNINYRFGKLFIAGLSVTMSIYSIILIRQQGVFYFPAPYHDGTLLSILGSYIPFVLLITTLPIIIILRNIIKYKLWSEFPKWLLALNSIIYLIFIGLFAYWGLFV